MADLPMWPRPAGADVPPTVGLASPPLDQIVIRSIEVEERRAMDLWSRYTCTEPARRKEAKALILKHRHALNESELKSGRAQTVRRMWDLNPNPQFIWVGSPQSGVCIAKLLSDLHQGFDNKSKLDDLSRVSTRPALPNAWRGQGTGSVFDIITDHINFSLNMNPPTQMFEFSEGKNANNLLEVALQSMQPSIGQIKLDELYIGRRLPLKGTFLGQHDTRPGQESLGELCGWVWDYNSFIIITERQKSIHIRRRQQPREIFNNSFPRRTVTVADQLQLHNENGPAIEWPDGWKVYAINNIRVPDYVVEKPHLITPFRINKETNIEVRRIMIDRYKLGQEPHGAAAFIIDSGGQKIDYDERFGLLWFLPQSGLNVTRWGGEENLAMLEVINRSPEPDGSFKHYYLRVPPNMRSAHEAAAWSFGMAPEEYFPIKET